MSQTPKYFNLYDIVMFSAKVGPPMNYVGIIVSIGDEAYRVRFYNQEQNKFGVAFSVTASEVEWIGPMPEGAVKDL